MHVVKFCLLTSERFQAVTCGAALTGGVLLTWLFLYRLLASSCCSGGK